MFGFLATSAFAQVDLQKVRIDKVVLKFVTNKPSTNRCLLWFPFQDVTRPVTEFDEDGKPFTHVQLRARVRGKDCNVGFRPQELMRLVRQDDNDLYFEVTVRPPITVIDFNGFYNGPDFRDQLIFEANSEALQEVDFFTFFKKSKVYFESRYATAITDTQAQILAIDPKTGNRTIPTGQYISKVPILPVFGGKIGIPFPWAEHVLLDFSMFQNLGNLTPDENARVQYSEFSFGANYSWSGKEAQGRPQIAASLDFRGRNIYTNDYTSSTSPFLVASIAMPGVGVDASWYPGSIYYSWEHWLSRIGVGLSGRYYFLGKIPMRYKDDSNLSPIKVPISTYMVDTGLEYRLTRKWALGMGWSRAATSYSQPLTTSKGTSNTEAMNNLYVRLILVPYIVEGEK